MSRPQNLSYSQVSLFRKCPAAYKMIYLEARKRRSSPSADFGIALHSILETALTELNAQNYAGVLTPMIIIDALDEFDIPRALAARGVTGRDWVEKAEKQISNFVRYFQGRVYNYQNVIRLEAEFLLKLKGLKKLIKGYIDRIDIDPDGTLVVTDYKTGRPPEGVAIDGNWPIAAQAAQDQLRLYAVAARLVTQIALSNVRYEPKAGMIRIEVWYLEGPTRLTQSFNMTELPAIEETWKRRGVKLARTKTWSYQAGEHCVWCDVRHSCPEYERLKP